MALKFIDMVKIPSNVSPKLDESLIVKDFSNQFYALITRKSRRTGSICTLTGDGVSSHYTLLNKIKSVEFSGSVNNYATSVFQATRLPFVGRTLTNNVELGSDLAQVNNIPSFIETGDTVFFVRPYGSLHSDYAGDAHGPFYIDEVTRSSFKIFPSAPQVFDSSYVVLILNKTISAVDHLSSGILENHEMITITSSKTIEASDTLLLESETTPYTVMNKGERQSGQVDLRLLPLPKVTHPEGRVVYTRTPANNAPSYTLDSGSNRFNFNLVYDTKPEDNFAYVKKGVLKTGDIFYIENNTLIPYTVVSIDDRLPTIDKINLDKQIGKHYRGLKQGPLSTSTVRIFGSDNKLIDIKDISKSTSIVSISLDESNQTPYFLISALDSLHNYVYYFVSGDFPSFQPDYLTRSLNLKYLDNNEIPIDFSVYQGAIYVLTDAKRVIAYTLKGVAMEVLDFSHLDEDITSIEYFSDFVSTKTTFRNPIIKNVNNLPEPGASQNPPVYLLGGFSFTNVARFDPPLPFTTQYRPILDDNGNQVYDFFATNKNDPDDQSVDDPIGKCILDYAKILSLKPDNDLNFPPPTIIQGPMSGANFSELTLRHFMAFDGLLKFWKIAADPSDPGKVLLPVQLVWVGPEDRSSVDENELAIKKDNAFSESYSYLGFSFVGEIILSKLQQEWALFDDKQKKATIPAIVHTGTGSEKLTQLEKIPRRFLRYLILTGSTGNVYFYDLIINRTVLSTKLAVNKPNITCSSSIKKIKNQLNAVDLRDEYEEFMSKSDAVKTSETCRALGISSFDYGYKVESTFNSYQELLSFVLDLNFRFDISARKRENGLGLGIEQGIQPGEFEGSGTVKLSRPTNLFYNKTLTITSSITDGIDLTRSILHGVSVYRESANASKSISFSGFLNSFMDSLGITISFNGKSRFYRTTLEFAPTKPVSYRELLQTLSHMINNDEQSPVNAFFDISSSKFKIVSKIKGAQGNLISFAIDIGQDPEGESNIQADLLSGNLENGLDLNPNDIKIDPNLPNNTHVYIERNNLFPVISGSSDSKAGITLVTNHLNFRGKSFDFTIKAWGDNGEIMAFAEIFPTLNIYVDKNYQTPAFKLVGNRLITDERGLVSGNIALSDNIVNMDSDKIDYLLQFKTRVVYQPNFNSLHIYDVSQTNIKGDERISFRVFGMQDLTKVKFNLVKTLEAPDNPQVGPPSVMELKPAYLGDYLFEIDFRDSELAYFISNLPDGSVFTLDAIEEIDALGQRYNRSNSIAIIYTGM